MSVAAFAADAFALGYALGGPEAFPVPAGARAAAEAALAAAEAHEHAGLMPDVIEAGRTEAARTALARRRAAQTAAAGGDVAAIVATITPNLDVVAVLAALAAAPDAEAARTHGVDELSRAALMTDGALAAWHQALHDAFVVATAQGAAESRASTRPGPPDPGAVADLFDAEAAAVTSASAWSAASDWLTQAIGALAGDLVRAAGTGTTEPAAQLASATSALGEARGAVFTLGEGMHGAYADSFVATHLSRLDTHTTTTGQYLNLVGEGDDRECDDCVELEDSSPYAADEFPDLPAHDGCRCWPEAGPMADEA